MWSDVGAVTGTLDSDSGNVVSLIANKYEVWYLINLQPLFLLDQPDINSQKIILYYLCLW